jgi:hypothetical protein
MFENLFEEANSIIKQNLEKEADKYILESDNLDEAEFTEGLEEILHVDDYEEVIVESIEDLEDLGLMEYEDMDLDEDDYDSGDSEEVDDSDEVDSLDELSTPEEDSYTSEDDDENGEDDDWLEESWLFEVEG